MKLIITALFAILLAIYVAANHQSSDLAGKVSSVMLQAMDRGYQCRGAGRSLADCQTEQRSRWASPVELPPFGSTTQ